MSNVKSDNRVIITHVEYGNGAPLCLFYLDSADHPIEIINLDCTRIGTVCEAKVIKKLKNGDGICNLSDGSKAYIKALNGLKEQESFTARIILDAHDNKDCCIVNISEEAFSGQTSGDSKLTQFLYNYEFKEIVTDDADAFEELEKSAYKKFCRFYEDKDFSLCSMYHLEKKLKEALGKRVLLKCGANIVFESVEALTVVDVNSAQSTKLKSDNYNLDINKLCAREIVKQLRLRSIAGIVIIDFINMNSREDEKELLDYFRDEAQKLDPGFISVFDITKLGLMEITRKRSFKPLTQQFM